MKLVWRIVCAIRRGGSASLIGGVFAADGRASFRN